MDSTIFSYVNKVEEKGSDGVPKSNEKSTQTTGDDDFRFSAQAR